MASTLSLQHKKRPNGLLGRFGICLATDLCECRLLPHILWQPHWLISSYNDTRNLAQGAISIRFYCAQREGVQTKPRKYTSDISKQQDRDYLTRYACKGFLQVVINDSEVLPYHVIYYHEPPAQHAKVKYVNITLTERMQAMVQEFTHLPPRKISP